MKKNLYVPVTSYESPLGYSFLYPEFGATKCQDQNWANLFLYLEWLCSQPPSTWLRQSAIIKYILPCFEMRDGGATRPSPRPPLSVPTTTEPSVVSKREIGVNGMWFRLFWTFVVDFLVIFRDFRHFSRAWMHLEALGTQENTGRGGLASPIL